MRNNYRVFGQTVVIDVKRKSGEVRKVYVSRESLPLLKSIDTNWCLMQDYTIKSREKFYVVGKRNGKQILLHVLLMGKVEGKVIDHIDGNPMNNRLSNLRHVSKSMNALNREGAEYRSKSGVQGVCWSKKDNRWRARVKYKQKTYKEKLFSDLAEAEEWVIRVREEVMRKETGA